MYMRWVLYKDTRIKDHPTYNNVLHPQPMNAPHEMQTSGLDELPLKRIDKY